MTAACVIYNPKAGRGRAALEVRRAGRRSGGDLEFRPTSEPGHAEELARTAAKSGFETVIAAGGDGTVHEVANGLLSTDADVTMSVWPVGSANDYAYTLGLCDWWRPANRHLPRRTIAADVGVIRSPDGRRRYFVNGMGLGFNADITLEAERVPWLSGMPLYTVGVAKALWRHFRPISMRVTCDGCELTGPTLVLSASLGRREGGFPLFPDASLTDGLFDCVRLGAVSRVRLMRLFSTLVTGDVRSIEHPDVWQGRSSRMRVEAKRPLRVHLDGEFFCHPEDGITRLDLEVIPGRLKVETFTPNRTANA